MQVWRLVAAVLLEAAALAYDQDLASLASVASLEAVLVLPQEQASSKTSGAICNENNTTAPAEFVLLSKARRRERHQHAEQVRTSLRL